MPYPRLLIPESAQPYWYTVDTRYIFRINKWRRILSKILSGNDQSTPLLYVVKIKSNF